MNLNDNIRQMEDSAQAIRSLAQNLSDDQVRWKPDPNSWSVLEVINHLWDEEREDFRRHLDDVLHHPERPWAGINPQGWVTERRYNERDLKESINHFLQERAVSVNWLKGLDSPDWEKEYEASWGKLAAGDVMVSWVAHDFLHLRQLVELNYAYLVRQSVPYQVNYAGEW